MAKVGLGGSFWNTLFGSGTAAHIHANFDRQAGGQNVDPGNDNKRKLRILRPGAIILPNLDIDEDLSASSASRTRFTKDEVDVLVDNKVNDGDDYKDITLFELAEPKTVVGNVNKLTIRVHVDDAKRIRIWEVPEGGTYKDGVEVISESKGHEHPLFRPSGGLSGGLPEIGWKLKYYVEALTLAGDPKLKAPADKAPPPPGAHRTPLPDTSGGSQESPVVNNSDVSKSMYDSERRYWDLPAQPEGRCASDVWIEIIHETKAGPSDDHREIGLFTIAPWIMTWNTLPCERTYVAYLASKTNWPYSLEDNHCMVWDLQIGCHAAGTANSPGNDSTRSITTHSPSNIRSRNDETFYVINESLISRDRWVQDEFEIGYCYAPHGWLHIALQAKRSGTGGGGLAEFVEKEMAHAGLGVYAGIADISSMTREEQDKRGSINFGGNLEVSPPVAESTPAIAKGPDGPAVKAHRKAPFGKIILGDYNPRPCEDEFREFLAAQMVQPILPVDTSWLAVGHCDEYLSFVRANDHKNFRLLFGRVRLMTIILEEIKKVDQAATFHRGKYLVEWYRDPVTSVDYAKEEYRESFASDWLSMGKPTSGSLKGIKKYSKKVEREKLIPIRERLKKGLKLEEEDVLSIPMYLKNPSDYRKPFGHDSNQTVAENVGMVNMLVVNDHLMIPRPHGPRLEPDKAAKAVEASLKRWFVRYPPTPPTVLPSPDEHFFWARPGETVELLAMYFARPKSANRSDPKEPRKKLIAKIKDSTIPWSSMHASYKAAVDNLKDAILNDPANTGAATPIGTVAPPPDHRFSTWMRVKIPDNTIDVFEGYMKSILENIGNTVHFIENFECYHELYGEVHCGTNVKRTPPELDPAFTDRWWDEGVFDPDYDTSYDPTS